MFNKTHSRAKIARNVSIISLLSIIVILIIFLVYWNATSPKSTPPIVKIIDENITINAGSYNYYNFSVPTEASWAKVEGTFNVSGSSDNTIEVYIMDASDFIDWQSGRNSNKNYESGELNNGNITASLTPNITYMLVYDNSRGETPKNVTTNAYLYYATK